MAVDFKKLLSKSTDEVTRPVPLPTWTYHGRIKGYEGVESKEKHTPGVQINLTVEGPADGMEPEDQQILQKIDLSKKALRHTFWLTPDSEYRLKDFIASCGIQTAGRTFAELLPEINNAAVLIDLVQKPQQDDPTIFFNEVVKVIGSP